MMNKMLRMKESTHNRKLMLQTTAITSSYQSIEHTFYKFELIYAHLFELT